VAAQDPADETDAKVLARQARFAALYDQLTEHVRRLSTVAAVDASLIEQYVTAILTAKQASETLTRIGPLVRNPDGSYAPNPFLAIFDKASVRCSSLARDLGIGPLNRSVLSARRHADTTKGAGPVLHHARTAAERTRGSTPFSLRLRSLRIGHSFWSRVAPCWRRSEEHDHPVGIAGPVGQPRGQERARILRRPTIPAARTRSPWAAVRLSLGRRVFFRRVADRN
jgi:P27 family predicted phage terminase small subunit